MKNLLPYLLLFLFFTFAPVMLIGQAGMKLSNPEAETILFGNYDPSSYTPTVIISDADSILHGIVRDVNKDTLLANLIHLDSFYNRNTGSDTLSATKGIGAARQWIFSRFQDYSSASENRLIVSYLDYNKYTCLQNHHKNVLAILPGLDTTKKELLVLEGHYDTRCEGACDTSCYTPGMEDNGSGTVLVMELARVMSRYAFDHTIIFAATTAEDQGLWGAKALSKFLDNNNLEVKACLNNDVIGGIICGATSSPPSCPYENHIDSTHVRIFSYSQNNDSSAVSPHKQLARYIKMHQEERINPLLDTPMEINIIIYEDRVGRSGDHIPFRQKGWPAIRFCSQNEHGNGSGNPPDRQHTSTDILGVDTDVPPDGIIDSFFVDMGYLSRNAIMNGVNLGFLALSPPAPQPVYELIPHGVRITMQHQDTVYRHYRVAIRSRSSASLDFDTVLTYMKTYVCHVSGLIDGEEYQISVANVNNNIESMFSEETTLIISGIDRQNSRGSGLNLLQNRPNPVTGETLFVVESESYYNETEASLVIKDMSGREVFRMPFEINPGMNKFSFSSRERLKGMYIYSLELDGDAVQSRKLIAL